MVLPASADAYRRLVAPAPCVLFTGRAGAGKDTIGRAVAEELRQRGRPCALLDAGEVRRHLEPGPAAIVWCCNLLTANGVVALVTVPLPTRQERERIRSAVPEVCEVYLDAPAEVATARGGARDDDYEEPYAPELRVPTHDRSAAASTAQVVSYLETRGAAPHDPPHPSEHPLAAGPPRHDP
jgi:adenylylsulfate kinase